MHRLLATLLCALWASSASAAYVNTTFLNSIVDSTGVHMYFQITGDAGEPPVTVRIDVVDPGAATVGTFVNAALFNQLAVLNRQAGSRTLFTPGQAVVVSAPAAAAASTVGQFAAFATVSPGTTPQDICTISGSATRIVTVTAVQLSTLQTTTGVNAWTLLKRSTLNSGGTSAAAIRVPLNATFPAATAAVQTYTVNATTPGTLVGSLWSGWLATPSATVSTPDDMVTVPLPRPIQLAATELVALNFGGVALPAGLAVRCGFVWGEQ